MSPDGWPEGYQSDLPGGGTLLDGAATDDTDGKRFVIATQTNNGGLGIRYTDDGVIPPNSTFAGVTARGRVYRSAGGGGGGHYWAYSRLAGIGALSARHNFGVPFINDDQVWATDPSGNAWALGSIFSATFGIGMAYDGVPVDVVVDWLWAYIGIDFDLPPPIVTTGAATGMLETQATFNGTLNPDGATATYPCAYYFEYGLTDDYGEVTATVNNLTGVADIAATGTATGLSSGTTYHFRLVGTNADQTVFGDDVTFVTPDENRFWLHEGHPVDGTLNPRALVRWDTIGFDIASQVLVCPVLTRDEDD